MHISYITSSNQEESFMHHAHFCFLLRAMQLALTMLDLLLLLF